MSLAEVLKDFLPDLHRKEMERMVMGGMGQGDSNRRNGPTATEIAMQQKALEQQRMVIEAAMCQDIQQAELEHMAKMQNQLQQAGLNNSFYSQQIQNAYAQQANVYSGHIQQRLPIHRTPPATAVHHNEPMTSVEKAREKSILDWWANLTETRHEFPPYKTEPT